MTSVTGRRTLHGVEILEIDADPSASGVSAPIGSIATISNGGGIFSKTTVSDTGWKKFNTGDDFVSVKDPPYNAKGDGVTNDTAAIQSAIDVGNALYLATGTQQRVFIPAGKYLVSQAGSNAWDLSVKSGIHLYGPGKIQAAPMQAANTSIISVQNYHDVVIEGLTLDGDAANQGGDIDPKRHGIFTRGTYNATYRDIKMTNIDGDAFYFGNGTDGIAHHCNVENFYVNLTRRSVVSITQGASYITITDGYAVNWSRQQSAALNIESTIPTYGNTFRNIYIDLPSKEAPHTTYALSAGNAYGLTVQHNVFPGAVFLYIAGDVLIDDNTITNDSTTNGGSGIQARLQVDGLTITNNTIAVSGTPDPSGNFHLAGIYITNTNENIPRDVFIADNRITAVNGLAGIYMNHLLGATVVRNNYINGVGTGFGLIANSINAPFTDLTIDGNTFLNTADDISDNAAIQLANTANGAANGFKRITIINNHIIDDQVSATNDKAIDFFNSGSSTFGDVLINGNSWTSNIINDISGLSYWRTGGNWDGTANTSGEFEGFGTPTANAITAATGSTYKRRNGSANTSFYIKESSVGSTGWSIVSTTVGANTSLSNISSVIASASLIPGINDGYDIGSTAARWHNEFITQLNASSSVDGYALPLILINPNTTVDGLAAVGIDLRLATTSGNQITASQIRAGKEQTWTSTTSTQDGYLSFFTTKDNVLDEKMRITSDGYISIGTTLPSAYLTVNNKATTSDIVAFRDNDVNVFKISDGGGVTLSSTGLSSVFVGYQLSMVEDHYTEIVMEAHGNSQGDIGAIEVLRSRGTQSSPLAVQNNDYMWQFGGRGYGGTSYQGGAYLYARAAESFTQTAKGTKLFFETTPIGSSSATVAMTLDPAAKLAVTGALSFGTDGYFGTSSSNVITSQAASWIFPNTTTATLTSGLFNFVGAADAAIRVKGGTTSSSGAVQALDSTGNIGVNVVGYGAAVGGSLLGQTLASSGYIYTPSNKLVIGTNTAFPLFIATNGTERLSIASDGYTVFNESGAIADVRFESDTEPNFVYLATGLNQGLGRVGIGTNVPAVRLHVYGTTTDERIQISSTNSAAFSYLSTTGTGGAVSLIYGGPTAGGNTGGSANANAAILFTSTVARLIIATNNPAPINFGPGGIQTLDLSGTGTGLVFNETGIDLDARLEGDNDSDLFSLDAGLDMVGIGRAANTHGAKLDVDNKAAAVAILLARDNGTEVFRIADGGNVGIGITNPSAPLDVSSNVDGYSIPLIIRNVNTANDANAGPALEYRVVDTSGNQVAAARIGAGKEQTFTSTVSTQDGYLAFYTATNGVMLEGMRLTGAQQLQLGNQLPPAAAPTAYVSVRATGASLYEALATNSGGIQGTATYMSMRAAGNTAFQWTNTANGFSYMGFSSTLRGTLQGRYFRSDDSTNDASTAGQTWPAAGLVFGAGTLNSAAFGTDRYAPSTAINNPAATFVSQFYPTASSPNYAGLQINADINGISSGKAAGLAVATKNNVLTGGSPYVVDFGQTSTDYFTGYNSQFILRANDGYVGVGTTNPISFLNISTPIDGYGNQLTLTNASTANTALAGASIDMRLFTTTAQGVIAARMAVGKEQAWTGTASTQDGYLSFYTSTDGILTEKVKIASTGVAIGTNATPAASLHIHRASGANPSFLITDGDVAHGMTTALPTTDTLLYISQWSGTDGGAIIYGATDTNGSGTTGLSLVGIIGAAMSGSGGPALRLVGGKKNGASVQAMAAGEVVFTLENGSVGGGTEFLRIDGANTWNWLTTTAWTFPSSTTAWDIATNTLAIDSTNKRVTIGAATGTRDLHVTKSSAGAGVTVQSENTNANGVGQFIAAAPNVSANIVAYGLSFVGTTFGISDAGLGGLVTAGTSSAGAVFGTLTSDPTYFGTNDILAMTIDTSQKVGIGTSSINSSLDIYTVVDGYGNQLTLNNGSTASTALATTSIDMRLSTTTAQSIIAAKIIAGKEQTWTGTASTQDGYMSFRVVKDGTLSEKVRIGSDGYTMIGAGTPTSLFQTEGAPSFPHTSVSVDTTLTGAHFKVGVDATGANRTINLPTASTCTGRLYVIKKTDATANTVTIDAAGSETIDGALTYVITVQYTAVWVQSTGSGWDVI